jgi:hypothetical protein
MQVTAPYAHAQAGKAERYVRTIEDGIQTLIADAKLPLSFWGDAALTTQYLRNRLPTSTLPLNTTPHEVRHGTKPDLSHLRVWGASAFQQYLLNFGPKVVLDDMRPFLWDMKTTG